MVQKSNSRENAEVNEAVRLLVDTMFRQRKAKEAFERYFRFSPLSAGEKEVIDDSSSLYYSEKYMGVKDAKTVARIFAARWNYEYQPVLLALGMSRLSSGDAFRESFEQAQGALEKERKRVLSKHSVSNDEFHTLLDLDAITDTATLERKLTALEQINADITRFIERQTNQAIFAKNMAVMQRDFLINKRDLGGHALYEVSLKPMFNVFFAQQGGILKMISFGDVL
jgi:sugar diacid utilization regulator